jgi:NTP pyrophosphatase (non-canonical NTP hydrolase)
MWNVKADTRRAYDWAKRVFGGPSVTSKTERAMRVAEEALELLQAEGVASDSAYRLVDEIWARPKGDPVQELGGLMNTVMIYSHAVGVSIQDAFTLEMQRVESKPDAYFRKRHDQKIKAGLSEPSE